MEDFGKILKDGYYEGKSIEALARTYRISRNKVTALLKAAGTEMRRRSPRRISKEVVDSLVEGYNQGLSMAKLSSKYNVSDGAVRNNLVKRGVVIRSSGVLPHKLADD